MAVLASGALNLPAAILDPWLTKIQYGSTVAALSNSVPMKFGAGQSISFDIGEAEYVGEGADKGASTLTPKSVSVGSFKFHKTIRLNQEVKWASEDAQMEAIEQILAQIAPKLSRALDFGIIHGVNPATGAVVPAMTSKLSATTNSTNFAASTKPYEALDAADELVLAKGYNPRSVAVDPALAGKLSTSRGAGGVKLYPNFTLDTAVSELEGHRASTSDTVGAKGVITPATKLLAVVGDFNSIQWGIQRELGLEMIEFGDPDGQGDLKRKNQIAFRMEVVYGWGIADLDAFAKIVDTRA